MDFQTLTRELEKHKKNGANMLIPSEMTSVVPSEFYDTTIEVVRLSSIKDDGDAYQNSQTKKYVLTKQGLDKLANCAGIAWNTHETRRIDGSVDRNYVAYQAVGGIRKPNGDPVARQATYDMDFLVLEEVLTDQYTAKLNDDWNKKKYTTEEAKKKFVTDSVRKEMLYKRTHKTKLCEAGAMNRVIRSLIGVKNGYTAEEMTKPFVMLRVSIKIDGSNEELRRHLMRAAVKSITGIYGDDSLNGCGSSNQRAIPEFLEGADVIDISSHEDDDGYIPPGEPTEPIDAKPIQPQAKPEPAQPAQTKSVKEQEIDFSNCDQAEQLDILGSLIHRKAYETSGFPKPIAEFSEKNRISFFRKLLTMPDAPLPPLSDDEIPF